MVYLLLHRLLLFWLTVTATITTTIEETSISAQSTSNISLPRGVQLLHRHECCMNLRTGFSSSQQWPIVQIWPFFLPTRLSGPGAFEFCRCGQARNQNCLKSLVTCIS